MMRKATLFILLVLAAAAVRADNSKLVSEFSGKPFFKNVSALEYHGHNRNFDVECDSTGKVYVANFEGLILWDGLAWKTIHTPGISRVTALFKSDDGQMWFGGYNVLGYLDSNDNVFFVASDTALAADFGEISEIYMENGEISFIAGMDAYKVHDGKVVENPLSMGGNITSSIWNGITVNQVLHMPDMEMTALATSSDGLVVLNSDGSLRNVLGADDGLCSNSITALAYDGKGSIWGVTDNGLFQVCIASVFTKYGTTDGLVGQVTSILKSDRSLYVGTLQGLFKENEEGRFDKVDGIDLACWGLAMSAKGEVLAATAEGLFRCTPEISRLTERHTLAVLPMNNGTVITGEVDGIYLYDSGVETCLNNVPNVCKLQFDTDGNVWAINYYNDVYCLTPNSSRFEKAVNSDITLLFSYDDRQGRHWNSNTDGMGLMCSQLNPLEAEWCRPLDGYSIEAMEVSGNSAWIGGNFGLIRMDLELMSTKQAFKPQLYLRYLRIEDSNVSYAASMDKADAIGTPQYSYRLNESSRWSRWSEDCFMNFGHLSSGNYVLSVRCQDPYGNISELAPVPFRIEPPFYMKWYAFVFYVFAISGISFGFLRYRLYKAKQEQLRLENLVEQRTIQLKEAQNQLLRQEREATVGKLTKGLIDRILNPMNYINNFSHLTQGLAKDLSQNLLDDKDNMTADIYDDCCDVVDMMKTNLDKIEQHGLATTRILKAMEELLKDHSGKLEPTDMEQLCRKDIEMLDNYFKDDIAAMGIKVEIQVNAPSLTANVNSVNMSKVLMSMLSNSVYAIRKKYQKKQTDGSVPQIVMTLGTGDSGKGCVICIYDNGTGIEDSILEKIFDPFFTTKPTNEAPGVGLYLSQQIIQDAGGKIVIDTRKDEYTKFSIILP